MEKVIVTGATGFIGNYLIETLVSMGIHVYALVRGQSREKLRIQNNKYLQQETDFGDTCGKGHSGSRVFLFCFAAKWIAHDGNRIMAGRK